MEFVYEEELQTQWTASAGDQAPLTAIAQNMELDPALQLLLGFTQAWQNSPSGLVRSVSVKT